MSAGSASRLAVIVCCCFLTNCGSGSPQKITCVIKRATSLSEYDREVSQYLDENTKHPVQNLGGQIVWNSRYYLESLITAYTATGNPKYIRAFEDSGIAVMGLLDTLTFSDVSDPSAPGKISKGPYLTRSGWPTYMGTFGQAVAVPTATGLTSLYAQSLYPRYTWGPSYLDITALANGGVQLTWLRPGSPLKSYEVQGLDELKAIASEKLVFRQSIGRIAVTGLGMPAPGHYAVNNPIHIIWHAEQTGGILFPFAEYLLIARDHPGDVDPTLAATWRSTVLDLAAQYVDQFLPDGEGGYTLHNPIWMAHESADTDAPSDYIYAEVCLRMLLADLTGESQHLALAKGLMVHQLRHNLPVSNAGWLVLRGWPDIYSWSSKSDAPIGSIWDSLSFDNKVPESVTEGEFFAQTIHLAATYNLLSFLGLTTDPTVAHRRALDEYLRIRDADRQGFRSSLRNAYPALSSELSDQIVPSTDPFAASWYLSPESGNFSDVETHWQWMNSHGKAPQGFPIGYFLRAWAVSEAAENNSCQAAI